jgi:DNA replication protein DnaC
MLTLPTVGKLRELGLHGMVRALEEQLLSTSYDGLSFHERLGLLVEREATERENRRLGARLTKAKLRQNATLEDIDYAHPRGLEKTLLSSLATSGWVREHHNVSITGPTGVGKSFLACALAHEACLAGFSALYTRASRLFQDLAVARGDGRYPKLLAALTRTQVLLVDDWGLARLEERQQIDFLDILEERHDRHSTLIASQFPPSHWHELMPNPTLSDAILDRFVHNAYSITLKGESMRKKKSLLTAKNKECLLETDNR